MTTQEVRRNAFDHITNLVNKPQLLDCTGHLLMCRVQGKEFGSEATRRSDNPYPKHTAEHQWFDAGWLDEQEELCGDGNGDLA